jgi:hypothetical protein
MLPPDHSSNQSSWSLNNIATSITLLKQVIGSEVFQKASQSNPDLLTEVQKKLTELENSRKQTKSKEN